MVSPFPSPSPLSPSPSPSPLLSRLLEGDRSQAEGAHQLLEQIGALVAVGRGCHRDDVEDEQIVDMLEQAVYDNDMDFMDGGGGGGEEEEMAVAQEQVNTCTCTQLKI